MLFQAVDPPAPVPLVMPLNDGCAHSSTVPSISRASRPQALATNWRTCIRMFSLPPKRSDAVSRTTKRAPKVLTSCSRYEKKAVSLPRAPSRPSKVISRLSKPTLDHSRRSPRWP